MKEKKNNKKQNKGSIWPFILLLVAGLALIGYPLSGQVYNFYLSHQKVQSFQKAASKLPTAEVKKRLKLAHAYNESLLSPSQKAAIVDPFSSKEEAAGRAAYAKMLEVKENIAYLDIPKLHQELPVYAGTSEEVLQKGIGHLQGSSLPVGGKSTRTVLTGHRGLPNSRLFTDLPRMKKGDVFYIHNLGQVLAYKVYKIEVIKPSQIEKLKIEKGKDLATLLTCTPYMINTHRLLVTGYRIPYHAKDEKKAQDDSRKQLYLIIGAIVLLILLLMLFIWWRKKKKKEKAKQELAKGKEQEALGDGHEQEDK